MVPAVILAAGASTRMGRPKALLAAPDGRPFLARIVHELASAGIQEMVVVTGDLHEALAEALEGHPARGAVRLVRNPDPSRGQVSSLWAGMDAVVGEATDALLVTLVDVPMVSAPVVAQVIEAWRTTRAPVVRPAIGPRHGHPVIFDRAVFDELRRVPVEAGAKQVVRAHAAHVLDVPVTDEGCLIDVDTPADYDALRGRPVPPGAGR